MKPDRILLAELRAEEAFDYLRNVNSGHPGSITSVHASSAALAFEQLVLLVKQSEGGRQLARRDIRSLLRRLIDVVMQCGVERHERFIKEIWYRRRRANRARGCRGQGADRMLTEIGSAAHELLRGWSGLALDYTAVQAPMWVAMVRGTRSAAGIPRLARSGWSAHGASRV